MKTIGITGQSGFIGTHLYNTLGLYPDKYSRIEFKNDYFENPKLLENFVQQCDIVIHLAALNRCNDQKIIYKTNIELVEKLIKACELTNAKPHIIFASSIQEQLDNEYGKSKKEGRKLLENWAQRNNTIFTALIIPNVFGPFGRPFYNSVISTFCYQLTHNESPKIDIDKKLPLIYVGELVDEIMKIIDNQPRGINNIILSHTSEANVSEILKILNDFKDIYFINGIIPDIGSNFKLNLFNTFVSYIDHENYYPINLKSNIDNRGNFVELIKLHTGGQVSFSTTKAGVTRGDHFHTRKFERFAVISGRARIDIRRIGTDQVLSFDIDGNSPAYVDMPIWYTHNITNIGNEDLYTIFWINEIFDADDPDTYFEKVGKGE